MKWLELRKDARAAIFFNENNELMLLTRSGNVKAFCYFNAEDTNGCLVYLDEIHTRGTDIILPDNYHAIVTLGARLCKDKFVQGCMRMRKLASSHSLSFCASFEVHSELSKLAYAQGGECNISSFTIVAWTIENNLEMIRSGFSLWASQSLNHLHLQSLLEQYGNQLPTE